MDNQGTIKTTNQKKLEAIKDNLTKWVEELRSDKWQQTKGTLCRTKEDGSLGYCCLGVFQKAVLGKDTPPVEYMSDDEGDMNVYDDLRQVHLTGTICHTGINMNDCGRTFEEIADEIERLYLKGDGY